MAEPITVTIKNLNSPIRTVKVSNKVAESAVTSVAGRVGDVVLSKFDVGLQNVNNTSDLDKPISIATQNALDSLSGLAIQSGDNISLLNNDAGYITSAISAPVLSVNGQTGVVVIETGIFALTGHSHLMSDVTDLATGVISLTNKDLTDYTNIIHADQIHLRVKADTNLLKGQPVKYDSFNVGENAINVSLADQISNISIGLAEEDISQGNFGNIITAGILDDVDTSDFNEGEILYVNGNGLLTGVEPLSGYSQPIAFCLKSQQNNGALQVLASYPKQPSTDVRNDSTVSGANVTEALDSLLASITAGGLQSGDNVSLLVNDALYTSSGDNVSLFANDAGYLTSSTNQNWYITKLGDETSDAAIGLRTTWMIAASGKIHDVAAGSSTVVSGASIALDVKNNGTSIFSTLPTIDNLEQTTVTAATGSVLSSSPTTISPGDKITFEVDTFGGVGGAGLHVDLLISWD